MGHVTHVIGISSQNPWNLNCLAERFETGELVIHVESLTDSSWQVNCGVVHGRDFESESLPRDGASAAAQGTSPSAPTRKREPKGRPTSGCSEQVLFPIFTVLRPHRKSWFRVRGEVREDGAGRVVLTLRGWGGRRQGGRRRWCRGGRCSPPTPPGESPLAAVAAPLVWRDAGELGESEPARRQARV